MFIYIYEYISACTWHIMTIICGRFAWYFESAFLPRAPRSVAFFSSILYSDHRARRDCSSDSFSAMPLFQKPPSSRIYYKENGKHVYTFLSSTTNVRSNSIFTYRPTTARSCRLQVYIPPYPLALFDTSFIIIYYTSLI